MTGNELRGRDSSGIHEDLLQGDKRRPKDFMRCLVTSGVPGTEHRVPMYNPLTHHAMNNYKKNDATTKVRILKPILDDWNAVQGDTWVVEKSDYDSKRSVVIRRADRGAVIHEHIHEHIHGSLAHDITCICNAYDWCWAIYFDEKDGFYMSI